MNKLDKVTAALINLFRDTSVTPEENLRQLEEVEEQVSQYITAIKQDMATNGRGGEEVRTNRASCRVMTLRKVKDGYGF